MLVLVIILLGVFVFYKIYSKFYFINVDNTLMLSGAPGTGKTNEGVKWALKLWRANKRKVKRKNRRIRFHNLISKYKQELLETPRLYSSIPIRIGQYSKRKYKKLIESLVDESQGLTKEVLEQHISRTKFCFKLKPEHLLEQERLALRSVVFITELGKIASQFHWSNENVQKHLDDFISMWRQYGQGGYVVVDDQSSDNVVVQIRRRIGTVKNMLHFRKFWKIYWTKMRNITISEDIKTIEEESAEDSMRWHIGMFPLFHRNYDTYTFSERYTKVPKGSDEVYTSFKTNEMLKLPDTKVIKIQGQSYTEGLLETKLKTTDDFILTVDQDFQKRFII